MATANTFVQIGSTVTVGSGGAASFTFTSIPATYTDLIIKVSGRDNRGFTFDNMAPSFNASTSNISTSALYAYGGTATPAAGSGANYQYVNGNSGTANLFSNYEWYIPNYAGSNYKSISSDSVTEDNSSNSIVSLAANLWSITTAINEITFTPVNGSLLQYTTASLYGILQY